MTTYDVIYYWTGGREVGEWNATLSVGHDSHYIDGSLTNPTRNIDDLISKIRRQGYVAHRGLRSIGPPEGPPTDAEFKALGL